MARERSTKRIDRRFVRRARRIILIGVGLPFLLSALLILAFNGLVNLPSIREALVEQLDAALPGRITYERLMVTAWPIRVHLYGVRMYPPGAHTPSVSVGELHATVVGSLALIPERIRLRGVRLDDVELTLGFDAEGNLGLVDVFVPREEAEDEQGESGPGPGVVLDDVTVRGMLFTLDMPEVGVLLSGVDIRGRFSLRNGHMDVAGSVTAKGGVASVYQPDPGNAGRREVVIRQPLDSFGIEGFTWRGDTMSARRLVIRGPGLGFTGEGAMYLGEVQGFSAGVAMSVDTTGPGLGPLLDGVLGGELHLEGHFNGLMDHAQGRFSLWSDSVLLPGGVALTDLEASAFLDGERLSVDRFEARGLGGRVGFLGELGILSGDLSGELQLDGVRPADVLGEGAAGPLAGASVRGRVSLGGLLWAEGPLKADVRSSLVVVGLARPMPPRLTLDTVAAIRGDEVAIERLSLVGGPTRLSLAGGIRGDRMTLTVDLDTGPLGPILAWQGIPDADGSLVIRGSLGGTFTDPGFTGEVMVTGGRYGPHGPFDVTSSLTLRDGNLDVSRLSSRGAWGRLEARGRVRLWDGSVERMARDPSFALTLDARGLDLSSLSPEGLGLTGRVERLGVQAEGRVQRFVAEVAALATGLRAAGLGVEHLEVDATVSRVGERLAVQARKLSLGLDQGGVLDCSGRVDTRGRFSLDARAEGLPVGTLASLAGQRGVVDGRLGFGLHGEGSWDDPRLAGDLLIKGLELNPERPGRQARGQRDDMELAQEARRVGEQAQEPYTLGDATFHLELGSDGLLRVSSRQAFGHYDLDASVPVRSLGSVVVERAEGRLYFEDLPLEEVVPGLRDQDVTGRVSGSVVAAFKDGEPVVALELGRLSVRAMGQELSNRRPDGTWSPLRLRYGRDAVVLSPTELVSSGQVLLLDGRVDLADDLSDSTILLRAKGGSDLAVLRPFVPRLPRLSGTVTFRLEVRGLLSAPVLVGYLALDHAGFQVAELGQELVIQRGRIFFSPGRVVIPEGTALVGTLGHRGAFSLAGFVDLPQRWPLEIPMAQITFRAERLTLARPEDGIHLVLDVPGLDITARGLPSKDPHIEVGGEVKVASGRFVKGFTDPEALAQAIRGWFEGMEEGGGQGLPEGSILRALSFKNLRVTGDEGALDVSIQAAIMATHIRLQPDLTLSGGLDSPSVAGSIGIRDGDTITLMDRVFRITRSEIRFDGSIRPLVDLEAETEVVAAAVGEEVGEELSVEGNSEEERTYHITLYLEGRLPDDLEKFELVSPQTSDQRELWTLLLLGYRYSDLVRAGRGGDVGGEVLLSSALQILSQKLTEEALKEVRLVDRLTLLARRQDVEVRVSKKMLGGKLELLGSGTFSGAQSEQSLGLKLYLRERLFLELTTTPGSDHNPMSGRLGWQIPLE